MDPKEMGALAAIAGGAAAGLSAPLRKLVEVTASGISSLTGPVMLVLSAHGEGTAALVRARYERKIEAIRAKASKPIVALEAPAGASEYPRIELAWEEADGVAAELMVPERELRRRRNLLAIVAEAADLLRSAEQVSTEKVDEDWTARFFADAKDVSSADLQRLWGALLARKVCDSSSVPMRTLSLLRDLDREEANLFQSLCSTLTTDHQLLKNELINNENAAQRLVDAGLLNPLQHRPEWHRTDAGDEFSFHTTFNWPNGFSLTIRARRNLNHEALNYWVLSSSAKPLRTIMPKSDAMGMCIALAGYLQGHLQGLAKVQTGRGSANNVGGAD